MQVVVLVGGCGPLIESETNNLREPLGMVEERPFLECLIEKLRDDGLTSLIFCLHHQADNIIKYFGNGSRWGVDIDYSLEDKPPGTMEAIRLLRPLLEDTFWVVNADTYLDCDLGAMRAWHKNKRALVTVGLASVTEATRRARVEIEPGGRITGLPGKEAGDQGAGPQLVNTGWYLMEPEVLKYIPRGTVSWEGDVLPRLIHEKRGVYGFQGEEFFDIGLPEGYHAFLRWMAAHPSEV